MDRLGALLLCFINKHFVDWDVDRYVDGDVIMSFTKEDPWITQERQKAVEYLRSFTPSKYVLDGAQVSWVMGMSNGAVKV